MRKNANGTCAMLSEARGGEVMKTERVFERHERFKRSSHVEITSENNAHHFLQYKGKRSL
jgi:hypothetical protein